MPHSLGKHKTYKSNAILSSNLSGGGLQYITWVAKTLNSIIGTNLGPKKLTPGLTTVPWIRFPIEYLTIDQGHLL